MSPTEQFRPSDNRRVIFEQVAPTLHRCRAFQSCSDGNKSGARLTCAFAHGKSHCGAQANLNYGHDRQAASFDAISGSFMGPSASFDAPWTMNDIHKQLVALDAKLKVTWDIRERSVLHHAMSDLRKLLSDGSHGRF